MSSEITFKQLGLNAQLIGALDKLGYENPTPVQEQSIPVLLKGKDIVAQAQTGTGKTAAFALPILNGINTKDSNTQAVVLAPTRELAIQVADNFKAYSAEVNNLQVLPIYGGQPYHAQLKGLRRGAQIVVGTPGRVMDHIRRGTLKLDTLKMLVLDEADEMLNMGFLEDVEWILEQIKSDHQTALFSATMPARIKKIANNYLNEPEHIRIEAKHETVSSIKQIYILVEGRNKFELLLRTLEVEDFDAVIVFARTKRDTVELSDKLCEAGYAADALNGDMNQNAREKVINRFKKGTLDIVIATDVAARGLDVERITHVINYDIPTEVEPYVHRIGRTGRAGRSGKAILFVAPNERRLLRSIESTTRAEITPTDPPSTKDVQKTRHEAFSRQVVECITTEDLKRYQRMIEQLVDESNYSQLEVAAALASMARKSDSLQFDRNIDLPSFNEMNKRKEKPTGRDRKRNRSRNRGFGGGSGSSRRNGSSSRNNERRGKGKSNGSSWAGAPSFGNGKSGGNGKKKSGKRRSYVD